MHSLQLNDFANSKVLTPQNLNDLTWRSMFLSWANIGARHGAMSIYGFGEQLQALNYNLKNCPTIMRGMNMDEKKKGQKLYAASFPGIAKVRHSAGHPGEFGATPEKFTTNSVSEDFEIGNSLSSSGARVLLEGCTFEGRYTSTVEGTIVSYELSKKTYENLIDVKVAIFNSFYPVEDFLSNPLK